MPIVFHSALTHIFIWGVSTGMAEGAPSNRTAGEIDRLLEQLESGKTQVHSPRRYSPWWVVVATLIASPMLPLATFVYGMVQSEAEQARRERELGLAEQAQVMSQERDWLQIAVDPARPEAQRRQVLRFLAKGEGRIAAWAREHASAVDPGAADECGPDRGVRSTSCDVRA